VHRGVVRIAGPSSLVPPVVLPALAPLLRDHPAVQIEIQRETDRRRPEALASGRIDLAISQDPANKPGIVDTLLGEEEYVVVESRRRDRGARRHVFLDVSPGDNTTESFFPAQPASRRPRAGWTRSFMHDEPGILLGVELGLGRAVKPRHTLPGRAAVRVDPRYVPVRKPVFLQVRRQRYPGRLHRAVSGIIESAVRRHLAKFSR